MKQFEDNVYQPTNNIPQEASQSGSKNTTKTNKLPDNELDSTENQ